MKPSLEDTILSICVSSNNFLRCSFLENFEKCVREIRFVNIEFALLPGIMILAIYHFLALSYVHKDWLCCWNFCTSILLWYIDAQCVTKNIVTFKDGT